MPHFRVDDGLHSHPKAQRAGDEALGMWARAGSFCMAYLTDGFVPEWWVKQQPKGASKAKRLIAAGLWQGGVEHEGEKGFRFHEFVGPGRQDARAQIEADREKWRKKKAAQRGDTTRESPPLSPGDTHGDSSGDRNPGDAETEPNSTENSTQKLRHKEQHKEQKHPSKTPSRIAPTSQRTQMSPRDNGGESRVLPNTNPTEENSGYVSESASLSNARDARAATPGADLVRQIIPSSFPSAEQTVLRIKASALIKDGTPPETVAEALRLWLTKPHLGAGALPSCVSEVIKSCDVPQGPSTVDRKVNGWLNMPIGHTEQRGELT